MIFEISSLKPIFHCDAKPFALGTFASPNAKDSTFALPNAQNTNRLVSFALVFRVTQRRSVEYRLHWVPNAKLLCWPCTFHVFLCRFHLRLVPNANPVSSGIWALIFRTNAVLNHLVLFNALDIETPTPIYYS